MNAPLILVCKDDESQRKQEQQVVVVILYANYHALTETNKYTHSIPTGRIDQTPNLRGEDAN